MTTLINELTAKNVHHARLAKAQKLDKMLRSEYPALVFTAVLNDIGKVETFTVTAQGEDELHVLHEGPEVPELAALLEAAEDLGIDPEQAAESEDDEPKLSGSVVAEGYRAKYREVSSTKQSCGDWLAEQLAIDTLGEDGFRVQDFEAILVNNSVDQSGAWARLPQSGQKGWIGRWRMNGRQLLEKVVALNGVYFDVAGAKHEPEARWLMAMRSKHGAWIAKQRKMEAALKPEVEGKQGA